jgi:hypothetical protein
MCVYEIKSQAEVFMETDAEIFSSAWKLESNDVRNTMQLAVFLRGSHMWFSVAEELASFVPVKGTTTRAYLYEMRCRKSWP